MREASAALAEAGCSAGSIELIFGADLRYFGQQSELTVAFDADPRTHRDAERIVQRVRGGLPQALWRQSVARADRAGDLARHRARADHPVQPRGHASRHARPRQDVATRPCLDRRRSNVPVYDRKSLAAGQTIAGPAIIEERETTTAIPPGWSASDRSGRLHHRPERLIPMDGVELEILWSNLIGIVDERAKALQRIAFSPIVREAGDLACALFDRRGRMVAQANTGTPGHINSLAIAGAPSGRAASATASRPATC